MEKVSQPYAHVSYYSHGEGVSTHVVRAIARYLASTLDLATTCCFLLFQDIRLPPMKTQYPEVERLSVGEPTQSASV